MNAPHRPSHASMDLRRERGPFPEARRRPLLVLLLAGFVSVGMGMPGCGVDGGAAGVDPGDAGALGGAGLPESGPEATPGASWTRSGEAARLQGLSLAEDRATAVVRAAESVSPSVVSVNVLRTRQVRVRDPFDDFFGGFFGGSPLGGSRTESTRVPGLGSGFVLDDTGLIVTNDHVVRGADRILVTFPDGTDAEAELVGSDEATDVAVLRIEGGAAPGLRPVALGRSRDLRIGEWVIAFGNPFGSLISNPEPTVTVGVVSALGRHIVPGREERGFYLEMIQTDAAINPGNSGGPLVNAAGEVVGMNASIFSRSGGSEGLGFAIPIERVLRIAEDLAEHGTVLRSWIGVEVEAVEADAFGRTRGVRVARAPEGSPGARAGLGVGDRLVRVNDRRLTTPLDFEAVLLDLRPGDPVHLEVEGRSAPLSLVAEDSPVLRAERVTILRDLQVTTLTPSLRSAQRVRAEAGVLVTGVGAGGQNLLQLREGDVILGIGQRPVESAEELAAILEQVPAGARVTLWVERSGGIFGREFFMGH